MAVNPDFRDLFATLNGAGAEDLADIAALHRMEEKGLE